MARIVPKLNLNRTPQVVENNSLIFAKNIKVNKDGSITRDTGISSITPVNNYVSNGYTIVGFITYNTCVYFFLFHSKNEISKILRYDEKVPNIVTEINSAWSYEGLTKHEILNSLGNVVRTQRNLTTTVTGEAIVNLNSDIILIIAESGNDDLNIPIKFININRSSSNDDQSSYTQSPKIPIINLLEVDKYTKTIPNGVYQFFVRYEIKKNFYTNWIPCSKELFSGTPIKIDTLQGSVKCINIHSDSSQSFVFSVQKLCDYEYYSKLNYKSFQIGFILSHDDSTVARSWKHFDFSVDKIYFDYDTNYIEEINIDDMLDSTYQIYNVKNITNFKNKIYISNYKESNINPDISAIQEAISNIQININELPISSNTYYTYNNIPINTIPFNSIRLYTTLDGYSDWSFYDLIIEYQKLIRNTIYQSGIPYDNPNYTSESTYHSAWYGEDDIDEDRAKCDCWFNILTRNTQNPRYLYVNSVKIYYSSDESDVEEIQLDRMSYPFTDEGRAIPLQPNGNYIENEIRSFVYNPDDQASFIDIFDDLFKFLSNTSGRCHYYAFDNDGNIYTTYVNNDVTVIEKVVKIIIDYTIANVNEYTTTDDTIDHIPVENVELTYNSRKVEYRKLIDTSYLGYKSSEFINHQTLIPFKTYAFYIHYVKESGETTNGYFIGSKLISITPDLSNDNPPVKSFNLQKIIYPSFENIPYLDGYPYCFISIVDTKNKVAQVFEDNCLEIDSLLLPINKDIRLYDINKLDEYITNNPTNDYFDVMKNDPNQKVDYIYSGKGDHRCLPYFGASGKLFYEVDYGEYETPDFKTRQTQIISAINNKFIVIQNEKNEEYIGLTKCTPYIKCIPNGYASYNEYSNLNLLGYICQVYKPTVNEIERYISGSDVYIKDVHGITLEVEAYDADNDPSNGIKVNDSTGFIIYSEFNLDYLSLSSELSTRIFKSTESLLDDSEIKHKYLLHSFESLTLSDVYELKSMYRDYRKKLFYPIETDSIINFNNTIRASNVFSDEGITYILKFEADKYYNVPTDKGYIVNLKSIADKILVHTQDSLFGFSGSSKLSTQDGNAQLSESDPFDTGITELFGSEHGFVGLSDKNHTMLCYDGYFFFDKDAKIIYDYNGQGLTLLSDPIEEIFRYKIKDVIFANDYYNDRFFVCIKFDNQILDKSITLSFNYKQKTFVSIHDFNYDKSFSTKTNCYFVKNNKVYVEDKNSNNYNDIYIIDTIYPKYGSKDEVGAIIDIIYNNDFERIKTLNSIQWIGSKIQNYIPLNNALIKNPEDVLVSEADERSDFSVDKIQIYSDTCKTKLEDVSNKDFHNNAERSLLQHKYPSFNNGIWSYNYFRNVLTDKNNTNLSDDKSLIYGKYFVVRFVFNHDNNFKIENVNFNIQ